MSTFNWSKDGATFKLDGTIDEFAQLPPPESLPSAVTFDLGAIRRINSLGVRKWMQYLASLAERPVTLVRCPPAVVEQLNCIRNFRGHAKIESVLLPYACDACSRVNYVTMELQPNAASKVPATSNCTTCGAECEFDDVADRYLGFASLK